jgi:ATP-dependent RNA helicase DDX19/DBP5
MIDGTSPTEVPDDKMIDGTSPTDALHSVMIKRFDDPKLALPPSLIKGLYEMNFTTPSKIQAISLPKIWANYNLLAQSHNGTGKTACFVLGMLRIVQAGVKKPQALCMCPTRELAKQIAEETNKMGKYMLEETGMTVKCILKEDKWQRGEKMPDQIVVGTPGKIWTLILLRVLDTAAIKVFMLDEADEMLTAGHGDNTKRIRKVMPRELQTLFFSATWKEETVNFANSLKGSGPSWAQVTIKRQHIFNDQVKQYYLRCNGFKEKEERLGDLIAGIDAGQIIVFVNTRDSVDSLTRMLTASGHSVSSIHGKMEERARDKALKDFHDAASKILIATNVLSRGIDVPNVTLVVQYDMPVMHGGMFDPETYLHRVGRTGRFGRKGVALNLIEDEKGMMVLNAIEDYYERKAPIQEIPPTTDPEAMLALLTVTQDTSLLEERAHGLEAQELLADSEALLSFHPGAPAPVDAPAGPAHLDSAAAAATAGAGAISDQMREAGHLAEWEDSKRIAQQDEACSKTHAKPQSRQARMLMRQLVRVHFVVLERAELVLHDLASALKKTGCEGERAVCATIATQVIHTCTTMVDKQPGMAYALSGFVFHVGERCPVLWECILARLQALCCYCVPYYPKNTTGNTDEFKERLGYKQGETKKDFSARMAGYVTLYAAMLQQSSIAQFPPQSAGNAHFDRDRPDAKMQTRLVQGCFAPNGVSPMARAWTWLARLLNHQPGGVTATILLAFLKPCAHAIHAANPTQFVELLTFLQTTYIAKIRDKVSRQGHSAEEDAALVNLESWLKDTNALLAKGARVPEPKEADMPEYKPPDDLSDANGGDF